MTQGTNRQIIRDADYSAFMKDVKQRIQTAQIKAAVRVNQELLMLYWDLGEQIIEKQRNAQWGDGFLEQMSCDLQSEFPEMKGFSYRNLKYMRQWVLFWQQAVAKITQQPVAQIGPQLVAQIPWGHNRLIVSKIDDFNEALFYVRKTIENNWSRAVLTHQIESGLYQRDGELKGEQDNPTIGILICKSKNDTVVEYSLNDVNKPIGVSEYQITKSLPDELKSSLPSIEQIEAEVEHFQSLEKQDTKVPSIGNS